MSQDSIDLLKVLAITLAIFALGTLVMLYGVWFLALYGANLPMVGSLPLSAPPEMLPILTDTRIFITLGAVQLTASGIALLLTSRTIDMGLLIASKAVCVVIVALIGFSVGHMAYLQINEDTAFNLQPLLKPAITLAAFFLASTALSLPVLRNLGNLRFIIAAALVLLGPLVLVAF